LHWHRCCGPQAGQAASVTAPPTDGHDQLDWSGRSTIKLVGSLDQLGEDQRVDHAERCWAGYDGYVRTVRRMIMWMLMIILSVVIMFFAGS
jgi:hypothetical protein